MKTLKAIAALVLTLLVVAAIVVVHARNASSLDVSIISSPREGDYRAMIQNRSVLPVYVNYCVKDVESRQGDGDGDERIQYTLQRKRSDTTWETVGSDLSCDSSGRVREGRVLWRGERLYSEWIHPNTHDRHARPERNFDPGDELRFILYLNAPHSSSGVITSPEFTLE